MIPVEILLAIVNPDNMNPHLSLRECKTEYLQYFIPAVGPTLLAFPLAS